MPNWRPRTLGVGAVGIYGSLTGARAAPEVATDGERALDAPWPTAYLAPPPTRR